MKRETPLSRILARRIAKALFASGTRMADRLVLEVNGKEYGGWAYGPAVDCIQREIESHEDKSKEPQAD